MHKFTKQEKATQQVDESESEEDARSEAKYLGDSNPVVLERTVWQMLSSMFGSRARNEK